VEIAEFAEERKAELGEIVDLPHGAPSHDTLSRVFRLLDPGELDSAFACGLAAMRAELGLAQPRGVVAIDGKSLRRGYDKGRAFMPPLVVSVWDSQTRLAILQTHAPGGDEVGATLHLLKGLVLKGCTVTADALHCRPDTAAAVRAAKAHYAFGLKGNQPKLLADTIQAFAAAGDTLCFYETVEQGHGRRERRRASVLPVSCLARRPCFPGLAAVGRIEAERRLGQSRPATSTRFVVLSRRLSPAKLLEVVRAHWGIENQLHWTLDVIFDEDDARTCKDYGLENLAMMRRLAHNILRAHPIDKPLAGKMRRARWSKEFFCDLFAHMQ